MKTYNIAITGFHASCETTAAQHIAYSLKTSTAFSNCKIFALNYDINTSGNFNTNHVDGSLITASPFGNKQKFYSSLIKILKDEKIDILIPTMDFEFELYSHLEELLRKENQSTVIAHPERQFFHNKQKLYRFCEKQKIAMPWTFEILGPLTIDYYSPYYTYPMILKNSKGQECLCYSLEEIYVFYYRFLREFKSQIYLQNFISGEAYSVCLLFGQNSKILGKIIVKKIIYTPNGESWGLLTVTAPPIHAVIDQLLYALNLNYEGPLEMKFKRVIGTDIFYVTDINTHFPSWIHLATKAGQNHVEAYLNLCLGGTIEKLPPYQPGMMLIKNAFDQVSSIKQMGELLMKGEIHHVKKAA